MVPGICGKYPRIVIKRMTLAFLESYDTTRVRMTLRIWGYSPSQMGAGTGHIG